MTPWSQQRSSHGLEHQLLCRKCIPCNQLQRLPHLHLVQRELVPNAVAAQLCHSGTVIRLSYWVAVLLEELMHYRCCISRQHLHENRSRLGSQRPLSATNKHWRQTQEHIGERKLYARGTGRRTAMVRGESVGKGAHLVALLESVRFNSSRENRNLTNSLVSCSFRSAQTFSLGARKEAVDGPGGGGGAS
jgi:hypothetical protein